MESLGKTTVGNSDRDDSGGATLAPVRMSVSQMDDLHAMIRSGSLTFEQQLEAVDLLAEAMKPIGLAAWLPQSSPGDGPLPIVNIGKPCSCPLHGPQGLMAIGCQCGAMK